MAQKRGNSGIATSFSAPSYLSASWFLLFFAFLSALSSTLIIPVLSVSLLLLLFFLSVVSLLPHTLGMGKQSHYATV